MIFGKVLGAKEGGAGLVLEFEEGVAGFVVLEKGGGFGGEGDGALLEFGNELAEGHGGGVWPG